MSSSQIKVGELKCGYGIFTPAIFPPGASWENMRKYTLYTVLLVKRNQDIQCTLKLEDGQGI